jgi:hypothetical protein
MSTYVLDIDSNIPLPKNAEEAMPPMTAKEELEVRARTIKLISDLQGKEINPTENDKDQARELAQQMVDNPARHRLSLVTTATRHLLIWQGWLRLTTRCWSKRWRTTNYM